MPTKLIGLAAFAPLLGLAALACGGDDDRETAGDSPATAASQTSARETPAETATSAATSGATSDATAAATSGAAATQAGTGGDGGFVLVGGDSHGIRKVRRCEPFSGNEDDLDLQALATVSRSSLSSTG